MSVYKVVSGDRTKTDNFLSSCMFSLSKNGGMNESRRYFVLETLCVLHKLWDFHFIPRFKYGVVHILDLCNTSRSLCLTNFAPTNEIIITGIVWDQKQLKFISNDCRQYSDRDIVWFPKRRKKKTRHIRINSNGLNLWIWISNTTAATPKIVHTAKNQHCSTFWIQMVFDTPFTRSTQNALFTRKHLIFQQRYYFKLGYLLPLNVHAMKRQIGRHTLLVNGFLLTWCGVIQGS